MKSFLLRFAFPICGGLILISLSRASGVVLLLSLFFLFSSYLALALSLGHRNATVYRAAIRIISGVWFALELVLCSWFLLRGVTYYLGPLLSQTALACVVLALLLSLFRSHLPTTVPTREEQEK